jgi:hypothetical protein
MESISAHPGRVNAEAEVGRRARFPGHLVTAARIAFGVVFFVCGLDAFLDFLLRPSSPIEGAMAFAGALIKTGCVAQLLKGTEVIARAFQATRAAPPQK